MADNTMKDLQAAYESTVIGTRAPTGMIVPGSLILTSRPDLAGEIDPAGVYRVTAEGIVALPEDTEP